MVEDWNSGIAEEAALDYAPQARLMVVDDDGAMNTYTSSRGIGDFVASRAAEGFSITRSGDVLDLGHYVAFPATWISNRADGAGNATVLLELTPDRRVLGQYVIGVTEETTSAHPAEADIATRVALAVAAHNGGDASAVAALFTPAAHARVGYDGTGTGWRGWLITCDSATEIESFAASTAVDPDWRPRPTLDAIQQGSLLIYPVNLDAKGVEFWVFRYAPGTDRFDYWWDIGGI